MSFGYHHYHHCPTQVIIHKSRKAKPDCIQVTLHCTALQTVLKNPQRKEPLQQLVSSLLWVENWSCQYLVSGSSTVVLKIQKLTMETLSYKCVRIRRLLFTENRGSVLIRVMFSGFWGSPQWQICILWCTLPWCKAAQSCFLTTTCISMSEET